MEKIIEEKERQGSKFLQWVWLGILCFVFLEIPRLSTFLFISGMFGSVQKFFVVADEKANGQMDKWSYLTALVICTLLAFGFGYPLPGLVMVGLALATLFQLYLLFKRPDASLEGRCFDWACLLLTVAMLLCLPLGYSKMRIDGLCF